MVLTGVLEIWRPAERSLLCHEACYVPQAGDLHVELIGVPDEPLEHHPLWIDPGCAFCRRVLATYPIDEQMERDFLRTVDECESEYLEQSQVIIVHCFFNCSYVTQSTNPQEAYDLMEQHYAKKHSRQIARIIGRYEVAL